MTSLKDTIDNSKQYIKLCDLSCEDSSRHRNDLPGFLWLLVVGNPVAPQQLDLGWSPQPSDTSAELDYSMSISLPQVQKLSITPFLNDREAISWRVVLTPPFLPDLVSPTFDPTPILRRQLACHKIAMQPISATEMVEGDLVGSTSSDRVFSLSLMSDEIATQTLQQLMWEETASSPKTTPSRPYSLTFSIFESLSFLTRRAKQSANAVLQTPVAKPLVPLIPLRIRDLVLQQDEEAEVGEWAGMENFISIVGEEFRKYRRDRRQSAVTAIPSVDNPPPLEPLSVDLGTNVADVKTLAVPLSAEELKGYVNLFAGKDESTVTLAASEIKSIIFERGLEPSLRQVIWPYLLGVMDWSDALDQKAFKQHKLTIVYEGLVKQWTELLADSSATFTQSNHERVRSFAGDELEDGDPMSKLRERIYRIEKDVIRTDRSHEVFSTTATSSREHIATSLLSGSPDSPSKQIQGSLSDLREMLITYASFNDNIGYVQGMNDLAVPFFLVFGNQKELTYACYKSFMDLHSRRFERSQVEMKECLDSVILITKLMDPFIHSRLETIGGCPAYFLYRSLLLAFKRDFSNADILRLWDFLFSRRKERMDLILAAALLTLLREHVHQCGGFDDLITLFNHLDRVLVVDRVLEATRVYYQTFMTRLASMQSAYANMSSDEGAHNNSVYPGWTREEVKSLISIMSHRE